MILHIIASLKGLFHVDDEVVGDFPPEDKNPIFVGDNSFGVGVRVAIGVPIICRTWETI